MKAARREFLASGAALGMAGFLFGLPGASGAEQHDTEDIEITPAEDLMREHGVLKRILLIYNEAVGRLEVNADLPMRLVADAAGILRDFIEDYHAKLEEDYLFPRFKKADKLVDLVDVLLAQHQAGRRLTDITLRLSAMPAMTEEDRRALAGSLRLFVRMYNPHEAREDTVLFPAIHEIVDEREYRELGEEFERREHELFGKEGFEGVVARVAAIEQSLGIFDLAQFTPQA